MASLMSVPDKIEAPVEDERDRRIAELEAENERHLDTTISWKDWYGEHNCDENCTWCAQFGGGCDDDNEESEE